jgi:quinolinate synthase
MPDTADPQKLLARIATLKKELGAIIVAHNYQRPEVQDIADFTGDSLELARQCAKVKADTIVFCGVDFMAETAKILNPAATVLLSESSACCPMSMMLSVEDLRDWKKRYPTAPVVCYVNTSAAVKAESYICCTSANGAKVVEAVPADEVLFVPDQNLGAFIQKQTRKKLFLYPGFCPVHARLKADEIKAARQAHPGAKVIVHPECSPEVVALADAALSTSQMLRFAREDAGHEFLIGTEEGILHRMRRDNPGKQFHLISRSLLCVNMKKTTLETVAESMEKRLNIITVPENMRIKAKEAVDRMLAVA